MISPFGRNDKLNAKKQSNPTILSFRGTRNHTRNSANKNSNLCRASSVICFACSLSLESPFGRNDISNSADKIANFCRASGVICFACSLSLESPFSRNDKTKPWNLEFFYWNFVFQKHKPK